MSFKTMLECRVVLTLRIRQMWPLRNVADGRQQIRALIAAYRELQAINRGEAV